MLLTTCLLFGTACGSSSTDSPSISCAQSLSDYCQEPAAACVQHLQLSSDSSATETSFCSQCAACSGQLYAFEDCADGTLAVATQVGTASPSKGVEIVTYLYDGMTFNLTSVLDSTTGGTYKASLTCLGGQQTLSSHGTCAAYLVPFKCP
jgi:hypothetical protein